MAQVVWTDNALADLNDIGEFIAKDSLMYAGLTVSKLFEATEILETHPFSGRKVEDFNSPSIRQLIRGSYRIVYMLIDKNRIDILAVHNSSRLLSNIPRFKNKK